MKWHQTWRNPGAQTMWSGLCLHLPVLLYPAWLFSHRFFSFGSKMTPAAPFSHPPVLASPWMEDFSFPCVHNKPKEDSGWGMLHMSHVRDWTNFPPPYPSIVSMCRSQGGTGVDSPSVKWGEVSLKSQKKRVATLARERKTLSVQTATLVQCNELLKNTVGLSCQFECFL